MTHESKDGRAEDAAAPEDAERDDASLESAEIGEEELEKVSGGAYPGKNETSPF